MAAIARQETFDEVHARISAAHGDIRTDLSILSDAAYRVLGHDPMGPLALRRALWNVYTRLLHHLAREQSTLSSSDGLWLSSLGRDRIDRLLEDHRQQRIVLNAIIDECNGEAKGDLELADDARWLVHSISKDLLAEANALAELRVIVTADQIGLRFHR